MEMVQKAFQVDKRYLSALTHLYCKQRPNSQGHTAAISLTFHFLISTQTNFSSPPSSPAPSQEEMELSLQKFLQKIKKTHLFGEKISIFRVKNISHQGYISAKHSYDNVDRMLQENFILTGTSFQEITAQSQQLFAELNSQEESSYRQFLQDKIRSQKIDRWLSLFRNPYVDALSSYSYHSIFEVYDEDEESDDSSHPSLFFESNSILNFSQSFDTRWELAEDASTPRTGEVCLQVNTEDATAPFRAFEVRQSNTSSSDSSSDETIIIKNGERACFSLNKSYYMSFFIKEEGRAVWFGTRCRYLPSATHAGKVLHYIGESGDYKCPVLD